MVQEAQRSDAVRRLVNEGLKWRIVPLGLKITSVKLASHGIHQRPPRFRKAIELFGLDWVLFGEALQHEDFVGHHLQIGYRPLPCARHVGVSCQGLTAEDDAAIGFGWGHELQLANNDGPVNGSRP